MKLATFRHLGRRYARLASDDGRTLTALEFPDTARLAPTPRLVRNAFCIGRKIDGVGTLENPVR
jgi:hypothetical protein